jgi:hypothetical protein
LVVDGKSPMSIARNLVLVRSNVMLTPLWSHLVVMEMYFPFYKRDGKLM